MSNDSELQIKRLGNTDLEAVICRCSSKCVFLKISQASQENTSLGVSFSRPSGLQPYQKETPTQVFSYEICENFKKIYFEEHLQTTASKFIYYTHMLLSLDVMTYYISYNI